MRQIALIITISFLFFGNNTHAMHQEATSYWQKDLAFCALVGFGVGLGLSYLGLYLLRSKPATLQKANPDWLKILENIREGNKEQDNRHEKIATSDKWVNLGDIKYKIPNN